MPVYTFTAPDGTEFDVTAPEGADQATVVEKAKQMYARHKSLQEATTEDGQIKAQPLGNGGSRGRGTLNRDTVANFLDFKEDELDTIKAIAGGDGKKEWFLKAVPTLEWHGDTSKLHSRAVSKAGAAGPYQFMAATAKNLGLSNRFDFHKSAEAAGKLYDELHRRFDGNLDAMLAAYNGGYAAGDAVLNGKAPPSQETQGYLERAQPLKGVGVINDASTRQLSAANQRTPEDLAAEQEGPPSGMRQYGPNALQRTAGKYAVAGADAALMIGTGALAAPISGIVGAVTLPFVGGEQATKNIETASEWLTWSPKSDGLKYGLSKIAPHMENVDAFIKDRVESVSLGSPLLAAAIETAANAALLEIGALGKSTVGAVRTGARTAAQGSKKEAAVAAAREAARTFRAESSTGQAMTAASAVKAQQNQIKATTEDLVSRAAKLGIELDRRKIHETVRRAAEGQAVGARGAGLEVVAEKLAAKKSQEYAKADALWTEFRNTQGFTDISWVDEMVPALAKELADKGFAIDGNVRKALEEIRGLRTRITTKPDPVTLEPRTAPNNLKIKRQSLNELQALRARLKNLRDANKGTPDGNALRQIGVRMDDMLDTQFLADAAQGITAPAEAWKAARENWGQFKDRWNENTAVAKIIADPQMTSEKLANTILGTSSMLGGKEASRIYDQIMVLTNNDPNVAMTIRGNVMFDLFRPLLGDQDPTPANFNTVANNLQKFRQGNESLLKSMGLKDDDMRSLQHAARVAQHTEYKTPSTVIDLITQGITRFSVGHEIAQAGFKVKVAQRVADWVVGKKRTSHAEMLREFAGIEDAPLTTKISREKLAEVALKGEMAQQYRDLQQWDDEDAF